MVISTVGKSGLQEVRLKSSGGRMLEEMKALAKQQDICVLATVSGDKPHCSLMAYAVADDCREIYMVTYRETSKYRNLMENPSVSLLIDTREEGAGSPGSAAKALTVSGLFQRIDDEDKRQYARARLLEKHPHLREFIDHPDAELLCIKVTSLLLLTGLTDSHYERV